jgi:trigger factor
MDIQITPKKSEGAERLLEVSVPAATVRDAEERAARRYASQARLPGFRPGKAPAAMVRKKFAEAIRRRRSRASCRTPYKEVLEREKLEPITQPHIHDLKFDVDGPLTFELHVEVRPEITLARTDGFRVERPKLELTDEMVGEQIDALRDQRATWAPSDDRRWTATRSPSSWPRGRRGAMAEPKEYRLELGKGQAIAGIEELIMEAAPGETIEREVRWPDDFPDEAQRGQAKLARVTLKDVKRKSAPELDDAFAREVGDFDSLDALRAAVRTDMERHYEREAEADVRQKLIDEIISANPFEVPGAWVNQLVKGYADAYQIPEGDRDRFAGEFREMAERQVRRDLVIDTIAQRESITASEADVDDKVAELAQRNNIDAGQAYAQLQKAGRLTEIERGVTEDRVFKYLMEHNTVE